MYLPSCVYLYLLSVCVCVCEFYGRIIVQSFLCTIFNSYVIFSYCTMLGKTDLVDMRTSLSLRILSSVMPL